MKKKTKRVIPYSVAHNKSVNLYKKTSTFLLWAGVLNLFSSIIGVIQMVSKSFLVTNGNTYNWPKSGFALSFSLQIYLNSLLIKNVNIVGAYLLIILIALILGATFALLGIFSSKGKFIYLIVGSVIYLLDFVAMFFVYNFTDVVMVWTNYAFTLAGHVVILIASVIAIAMFFSVIEIEKKYKGKIDFSEKEVEEVEEIAHGE